MTNLLEDHIDEPIKKVVVGLSLLGFSVTMSCCGFAYKGERVPKKHLDKAYVYLYNPHLTDPLKALLVDLSFESLWRFKTLGRGAVFIDFYANTWAKDHPWADRGCPHNYEIFVLAIHDLERTIMLHKDRFSNRAVIRDGNKIYKESFNIKYWQYEPTEDWIVTPETFFKL